MFQRAQYRFLLGMAGVSALACLPHAVNAQVTVTSIVTQLAGGVYRYNYTITNNTPDDLFDVNIRVLPNLQPRVNSIFNITAPVGFTGVYTDTNLGILDYTENSNFFTATPLSGFTYDSLIAPRASVFEANRFDFVNAVIVTTTSTVFAAVPEPGSLALFGSLGAMVCFAARKRRNRGK